MRQQDLAREVERRLALGGSRRHMERLMALRLGLGGEHTLAEIAEAVGRARSRVIEWMKTAREEGIEALLGRHQERGCKPQVSAKVFKGLRHGLSRGRWKRAKEAGEWLRQRHGITLGAGGVCYWLKKAGES